MLNVYKLIALASVVFSLHAGASEDILRRLDSNNSATALRYTPPGTACNGNQSDQGKFCAEDGWRLFWYYNMYQSEHMGFTRYGHLINGVDNRGSPQLLMVSTGGAKIDANDNLSFLGRPIKDADSLEKFLIEPSHIDPFPLPGAVSLYYKNNNSTTKIPEFSSSVNRFTQYVWMPFLSGHQNGTYKRGISGIDRPEPITSFYPFINDSKGGHYYHDSTVRPLGGWVKLQFDGHPSHHNAYAGTYHGGFRAGGQEYPGDPLSYFRNMTAFSMVYRHVVGQPDPQWFISTQWDSAYSPYENEETINNLSVGYSETEKRFELSFNDKYRCAQCHANYEIKYSFAPINNENYDSASNVVRVSNFFENDNNPENFILKPNPSYSQIWAGVEIAHSDVSLFLNGSVIYFAVKDKSIRSTFDAFDTEVVPSSVSNTAKRVSLIKTISMQYMLPPNIESTKVISVDMKENESIWLQAPTAGVSSSVGDLEITLVEKELDGRSGVQLTSSKSGYYSRALIHKGADEKMVGMTHFDVQVHSLDCSDLPECAKKELVRYSKSGAELFFNEFSTTAADIYTGYKDDGIGIVIGKNAGYNYVSISGIGTSVSAQDLLEFEISNTTETSVYIPLNVNFTQSARYSESPVSQWVKTAEKWVPAMTTVKYTMRADQLPKFINLINVNIPYAGQGILLRSISMLSHQNKSDLTCKTCASLLIDFFNGSSHSAPYPGWSSVIMDVYTGNKNDGSGIIVGKNGTYNYQGVKGGVPLYGKREIALTWRNAGPSPIILSPYVSFDDSDRRISGAEGVWSKTEEITIPAMGSIHQQIPFDGGSVQMINVNSNVSSADATQLSLDKIEVR